MADCYYCKYAYKYASEIVYGLSCFAEIRNKKKLKVMSVECGPCTELAAVDYLKEKGILNYEELQYRAIDPLGKVWNRIWNDIIEYFGHGINFYQNDILESKISSSQIVRRMHFDNVNKNKHLDYGDHYNSNALIFDKNSNEIKRAYNPFDSCASAQILIKKG